MTIEDLNLINLLPGLYIARDTILDQIATIEGKVGLRSRKRGRPRKQDVVDVVGEVKKPNGRAMTDAKRKQLSRTMKAKWAKFTPEEKLKRQKLMFQGRNKKRRAA